MKQILINCLSYCLILSMCISCSKDDDIVIKPSISNLEVEIDTYKSAYVKWKVSFDNDTSTLTNGICWSKTSNPGFDDHVIESEIKSGDMIIKLDELPANEEIYVRAYLKINDEYFYSEEVKFTLWLGVKGDPLTDIDGNVYKTIRIGNQIWTQENLKTTRFRNGEEIVEINMDNDKTWIESNSPMYCKYNDSDKLGDYYGFLYNSYVITDERMIAPEGFSIPSSTDWSILLKYLGGNEEAANYLLMPEAFISGTGIDENTLPHKQLYNFGGLASGIRWSPDVNRKDSEYAERNKQEMWWKDNGIEAIGVARDEDYSSNYQLKKTTGISIRCVKNIE